MLTGAALAQTALKMASISDPHLFNYYDAYNSNDAYCWPGSGSQAIDPPAYFGQFECDPPERTVRAMFEKLKNDHPDLGVILLPGDLVAHAVALEYPPTPSYPTADYTNLKVILADIAALFVEYFPNAIVLPTMGNNDTKYHY